MDTWKSDSSKKPRIRQKQSHEISEIVKQLRTFNILYGSQFLAVYLYR